MKLIDKLKDNRGETTLEWGIGGVVISLGLVALAVFNVGARIKDIQVVNNLEPNAIYARDGRVKVKNKDLDKNGKYESVLYRKIGNKEQSFLLQYDQEKGLVTKPYEIKTEYNSVTNKELKTIKILE